MDACWPLIKNLQFKLAKDNLVETNFDPREILVLFADYIPSSKKLIQNNKKYSTMNIIIKDALTEKLGSKQEKMQEQMQSY